ncbi:hypothetical protein N1851_023031 [Merluccius polli]|uniref:HMG domain-containing protein n=1 Tax=Merluccius polli TaxID=89951 RepID=A0AA47MGU6_MERPO|nr:hypothetical protein N1851_023031 [Merluccius polli]
MHTHERAAVRHGGYKMYKCLQGCAKTAHHHCCYCGRTVTRKSLFLAHVQTCSTLATSSASAATRAPLATATSSASAAARAPLATATSSASAAARAPLATATSSAATRAPVATATSSASAAARAPEATAASSASAATRAPEASVASAAARATEATATSSASAATRAPEASAASSVSATAHAPAAASRSPSCSVSPSIKSNPNPYPKILQSKPQKTTCTFCNLIVNKKKLKVHIQRRHTSSCVDVTSIHHLPSQCVDQKNGIFAVQRTFSGPIAPIHVQRCTWGDKHKIACELEQCRRAGEFARRSGLMGFQCIHLKSIFLSHIWLTKDGFLKTRGRSVSPKKNPAESEGCPLSQEIRLDSGTSKLYVSIKDTCTSYFSRLGRVVVYFDRKRNTWQCPCAKQKNRCPHKSIAKWHFNQTHPELFQKVRSTDSDVFDLFGKHGPQDGHSTGHDTASVYPPEGDGLMAMILYLLKNKKVPSVLPKDVSSPPNRNALPMHLIPCETFCALCPGKIPLSEPILVSQKAKIVMFTGVAEDVSTYCKRCGICGTFYRYQEWTEGLHNFDDHVILTLHLCLFLRQSVQNHTAVGRALDILEQTNNKKYPNHDSILHGYVHFEALTAHDYNYSCVNCGVHPPVVIMDLHKKGVFSMPVSDIEDPSPEFDGHVDVEAFWDSVEKEIVCRGFLKSKL